MPVLYQLSDGSEGTQPDGSGSHYALKKTLYASMPCRDSDAAVGVYVYAGVLLAGTELPTGVIGQVPCSNGMPSSQEGACRAQNAMHLCSQAVSC